MNFLELACRRCSVRQYSDRAVEPEKMDYVLEAARLAPSAVNKQPWRILLIESEEKRQQLQNCYDREWFKQAPLYLIICGNHVESWKRAEDGKDHVDVDVAILTEHLCLAAAEQGLGTCWVCNFNVARCKQLFDLPDDLEPIVLLPIGYPVEKSAFAGEKKRKALTEIYAHH